MASYVFSSVFCEVELVIQRARPSIAKDRCLKSAILNQVQQAAFLQDF